MNLKRIAGLSVVLLCCLACLFADEKSKKEKADELNSRSVQGVVADDGGNPVAGAIVQIENTKTLQVRSFVTRQDGSYYFHGLSANVDYGLKAESAGRTAPRKTLSIFDSRKTAILNFKLEPKKK
jgi:hypothetical protein